MPSRDLFYHFAKDLRIEHQWSINGVHYSRTLEDWLTKMDQPAARKVILEIFRKGYGNGHEWRHYNEWRVFNMACSELFKFNNGNEWYVSHYRFCKAVTK